MLILLMMFLTIMMIMIVINTPFGSGRALVGPLIVFEIICLVDEVCVSVGTTTEQIPDVLTGATTSLS